MDRAELERLDRESLVQRAQAAGIRRARVLTRPELVDELLRLDPRIDASQLKKTRGFFGRARDLLTRVVERGLHLPDAADRLRTIALGGEALPQVPRPEPQAVPTVTLAEIYAAQGHKERAIETLRRVLEAEPEHGAARQLLEKLEAADYVEPPPPLPPENEEQAASQVDEEEDEIGANLGHRATEPPPPPVAAEEVEEEEVEEEIEEEEVEEAEVEAEANAAEARDALLKAFVEAAEAEEARVRRTANEPIRKIEEVDARDEEPTPFTPCVEEPITIPRASSKGHPDECVAIPVGRDGSYVWWRLSGPSRQDLEERRFVVRALVIAPSWDGPKHVMRDIACEPEEGEVMLRGFPDHAIVRIAVGWLDQANANRFVPLAHSPALEITASRELVRWTLSGMERVALDDPSSASIARAAESASRIEV